MSRVRLRINHCNLQSFHDSAPRRVPLISGSNDRYLRTSLQRMHLRRCMECTLRQDETPSCRYFPSFSLSYYDPNTLRCRIYYLLLLSGRTAYKHHGETFIVHKTIPRRYTPIIRPPIRRQIGSSFLSRFYSCTYSLQYIRRAEHILYRSLEVHRQFE